MATYPINNKKDLIDALASLNDSDLEKAGLSKKGKGDFEGADDSAAIQKRLNLKREELQLEIDLANAVQDGTQRRVAQNKLIKAELEALQQAYKKKVNESANNEAALATAAAKLQEQLDAVQKKYGTQAMTLDQLGDEIEDYNKKIKDGSAVANKYTRDIDDLGKKMVIFGKGPLVQGVLKVRELGTELANSEEKQKQFRQAMLDTFNVTNIAGNLLNVVADSTFTLVMGLDAASTSLAAATGFGDQFNQTMRNAQQQGNYLGVSMQGAGKAIQGLSAGFTNFVNISGESRAALVAGTAQLERIGVSADTSAGLINFFNQNLGMTAEESLKTTKELAMMGKSLGMTSAQITKDFQSALPTLAVYGDRSQEVFKGLAGAAKVAGVEMNKLLGLAGKFDTFSSAAETTGKLNAILGSQISAVDMLRQTEDERIETLVTSMQAQGRSFKDMDRFTQKAIAAAAGIDDLAEAQRIFGMDLGQYKNYQDAMDKSAEVQKKFEEAVQATIPIQEKFKLIAAEFAVGVVPILEKIHGALNTVLNFFGSLDKDTQETFIGIASGILTLFLAFKAFAAVKAIIMTIVGPFQALGKMLGLTAGKTATAAAEMNAAAPSISSAMAQLSNAIATSMANISRGVISAAPAIAILTGALASIGLAAIALGYGLSQLQGGMLMEFLGFIAGLTVIVAGLAAAFAGTAGVGALAFGGAIGILAAGISALGVAMMTIPADRMASIASGLEAISNLSLENVAALGEVFSTMAVGMFQLSAAVNALDGKSVKVSSVLENLALLSVGTAKDSMTGAKISASSVNVVSNLENVLNFDGMKAEISIGGQKFREAVLKVKQT